MTKVLTQIDFIRTLFFNIKMFPFKEAIKLPVLIAYHTRFVSLKGRIHIDGKIKTGMVRFGFGNVGIVDKKYNRTLIELRGKIRAIGKANFGSGSRISVGPNGILEVGDRFSISANSTIICFDSVTLGNDVLFSWDILVMDTDFHETENTLTVETNINITRPIILGQNTWVGTRALILKGTVVPANTIIAANSLCNKKYEIAENCVLGGIPASVVRKDLRRKL